MTTIYLTLEPGNISVLRRAAHQFGAQFSARGARAVLTCEQAGQEKKIYLAAGVLPTTSHVDADDHAAGCAAWL
jgi:hypothetical protein